MSQTKQNTCSFLPISCFADENWKTEYVPVPIPVPVYVPVPMHMYSQSIPVPTTVPVPVREIHPLILVFAGSLGWSLAAGTAVLVTITVTKGTYNARRSFILVHGLGGRAWRQEHERAAGLPASPVRMKTGSRARL